MSSIGDISNCSFMPKSIWAGNARASIETTHTHSLSLLIWSLFFVTKINLYISNVVILYRKRFIHHIRYGFFSVSPSYSITQWNVWQEKKEMENKQTGMSCRLDMFTARQISLPNIPSVWFSKISIWIHLNTLYVWSALRCVWIRMSKWILKLKHSKMGNEAAICEMKVCLKWMILGEI